MTKQHSTKKALFSSILALLLCFSMLLGTTFAWFTDSVTSASNIIASGNLDVELYYQVAGQSDWTKVDGNTNVFQKDALWEPGHTEVVKLKVVNEGSLALKYQLGVNVASEVTSTNALGGKLKLSDHIRYGIVDGEQSYTRDEAIAAVDATASALSVAYGTDYVALDAKNDGDTDEKTVTMVVYMPTAVGNEANAKTGAPKPEIKLGLKVFATQASAEEDAFGPDYDADAPVVTYEVTPANVQEYLDGKHGSTTNMKLVLTEGDYDTLIFGRPTKYVGSNTTYVCGNGNPHADSFETTDAKAFNDHLADGKWHTTPKYVTTVENLQITVKEGAQVTVAGVKASTGHVYGDVYDYVRDIDYDTGSAYYCTLLMKNVTFTNVAFTEQVNLNTSDANTVYDGITFDGCTFTTGGTASSDGAALRYYNESNNGAVRNLTVKNSSFTNCYQGIYVHNVNGVTVTDNSFDTTGHNAIALQSMGGKAVNMKTVVITNNVFKNIGDRVLRFGDVGADTDLTLEYNLATKSGDDAGEAVKASTIEAGVKVTANYNSWGGTVVNPELRDVKTADLASDASSFMSAATNASSTGEILLTTEKIAVEDLTYVNFAQDTVVNGNGNTLSRESASGNPLLVNTTNKVTFENIVFESAKGSAVLATRKDGANIEVNDCEFQNLAAPSTGNTGVQVYASNVTMVFNRCTFNNMPVITNSSYPEGIQLVFNDCTFNWVGDNCSGFVQIANNLEITVDFNNCKMNYTTNSQYTTAKTMVSYNWPDACVINVNGLTVTGTRNNDKIWKIFSSNNAVTVNTTGELVYVFNGEEIDFATYLK